MGKRKNDPDAKNRSKAMHFSFGHEVTRVTKEKHIVCDAFTWEQLARGHNQSSSEPQTGKTTLLSYGVTSGFVLAGKGESKSQDESKQGILIPHTLGE